MSTTTPITTSTTSPTITPTIITMPDTSRVTSSTS